MTTTTATTVAMATIKMTTVKMTAPVPHGCHNRKTFPDPEYKVEAPGYSDPDIMHVLMDDAESGKLPNICPNDNMAAVSAPMFLQFSYLPAELRRLIWQAAAPEPAVLSWDYSYPLRRKVPAVLQACSEARNLLLNTAASERERRSEAPTYRRLQPRGRDDEGVYVDWQVDSLWIYRGCRIHKDEIAAYAGLENLVMNWGLRPCWTEYAVGRGVEFVRQFPGLKLLTLLVDCFDHAGPEPSTSESLKRFERDEIQRIWALVQKAFKEGQVLEPRWSPPSLRLEYRAAEWSRQEVR